MRHGVRDQFGDRPDVRAWLYADAYLRAPSRHAPLPESRFFYRGPRTTIIPLTEPGLWVPLSCAIAVVAHTIAGSANTTDVTTSSINTSGANFLALGSATYSLVSPTTVSDNKSNTWSALTGHSATASVLSRIYYAENATVGSGHTFTVSAGSATYPSVSVLALSGVKTSSALDVETGTGSSGVSSLRPGTVTPSEDNEAVLQALGWTISATMTIDQGFTISDQLDYSAGVYWGNAFAYLIETTATAVNPLWDGGAAVRDMAASAATFKVAGATTTIRHLLPTLGAG